MCNAAKSSAVKGRGREGGSSRRPIAAGPGPETISNERSTRTEIKQTTVGGGRGKGRTAAAQRTEISTFKNYVPSNKGANRKSVCERANWLTMFTATFFADVMIFLTGRFGTVCSFRALA